MKKFTVKGTVITMTLVGFSFFGFGVTSAEAASYSWLSPDWYAKYYNSQPATPTPAPQPEPTPVPEPQPEPTPTPEKPTTTTSRSYNYWTSVYGNRYSSTPTQPTAPTPAPQPEPTPAPQPEEPAQVPQGSGGMNAEELSLAKKINNERVSRGLNPLQFDAELTKWARVKSNDMIVNNYFAHESPTYGKVSDMLRSGGVDFNYAGENLGKTSSVNAAHTGFMNSSVHKATLLNSSYTHVGIGIKYKGSTMYVTEVFAKK